MILLGFFMFSYGTTVKGGGLFVFTKEIRYGIIIEEKICCVEEI